MPGGKQTYSHEVASDEKRLFEALEEGDRRAELEAENMEPVELDGNSYDVRSQRQGSGGMFSDPSDSSHGQTVKRGETQASFS